MSIDAPGPRRPRGAASGARPRPRCSNVQHAKSRGGGDRTCVYWWCDRLWPGTNDETGWPYVMLSSTCTTLLAARLLKMATCMVLWVMIAPVSESQETQNHSAR